MSVLICKDCGTGNDSDSSWAHGFDWDESLCQSCAGAYSDDELDDLDLVPKEFLEAANELHRLLYKISAEEMRGTPLVPRGHEDCQWNSDYPAELSAARHAMDALTFMLDEAGTSIPELLLG